MHTKRVTVSSHLSFLILACCLTLGGFASPAAAKIIVVTTLDDTANCPFDADGLCMAQGLSMTCPAMITSSRFVRRSLPLTTPWVRIPSLLPVASVGAPSRSTSMTSMPILTLTRCYRPPSNSPTRNLPISLTSSAMGCSTLVSYLSS